MPASSAVASTAHDLSKPSDSSSSIEKMFASAGGSAVVALLTTPFDVVARRLQVETPTTAHYRSTLDATSKIVRNEGLFALWRGVGPSLVMTVPATAFYFTFYQALRHSLEDLRIVPDWSTPLFAGPVARTTTVLLSAPLELVRTRVQARAAGEAGSDTIRGVWRDVLRTDGAAGLFRGVLPTLWRDVPFSMAYWFMYERTLALYTLYGPRPHYVDEFENGVRAPAALRNLTSERDVIPSSVHFAAGALSGSIAAVMTHPVDVLKTRRQTAGEPIGALKIALTIWRTEGANGFTRGMAARVAKITPACAIMIGSFEYFLGLNQRLFKAP